MTRLFRLFEAALFYFFEFLVEALDRESHDVEVGAVDVFDADVAYPFLDAVGACFVEGVVGFDVVAYFIDGDVGECYVGGGGDCGLGVGGFDAYACDDLVGFA